MFKYKTDAEIQAMTEQEANDYAIAKRAHEADLQEKAIAKALEPVQTELKEAKETAKKAKENAEELALKVVELETKAVVAKENPFLSVVKENREGINKSTKDKGDGKEHEFTIKADTLRASVVGNPAALDLGMNTLLATRKLTVYDLFPKVPVGKNRNGVVRYVDWDAATTVKAAAAIAEGTAFPSSTAKWATYTLGIQKVGTSIPVSEEFTYDDEMYVAEVSNFIVNDVDVKVDFDLVNGNGTVPNIKGLVSQTPAYVPVASGITDASIYDLIVDLKRSVTLTGGSKFNPDFALMNIADINKMLLKKDVNKQYVAPPFVSNGQNGTTEFVVAGVRIIECNAITVNTMILGCTGFAKIYEEPGVTVATGYDGSDWSEDMMTLKARRRLNILIRTQDQVGFARVTSISTALTTLAT
jgi:hypothetical protein